MVDARAGACSSSSSWRAPSAEIARLPHLEQRQRPADAAAPHVAAHVPNSQMAWSYGAPAHARLGRVPALRLDVARQHLLLQALAQLLRHADAPGHRPVAEERDPAVEQHQDRHLVGHDHLRMPRRRLGIGGEAEPVERVRRQREEVRQVADRRKRRAAHELHGDAALEAPQVELDRLRRAREVGDAQDRFVRILAQVREDLAVARIQEREPPAAERAALAPDPQHALGPVELRPRIALLRLDVHRR